MAAARNPSNMLGIHRGSEDHIADLPPISPHLMPPPPPPSVVMTPGHISLIKEFCAKYASGPRQLTQIEEIIRYILMTPIFKEIKGIKEWTDYVKTKVNTGEDGKGGINWNHFMIFLGPDAARAQDIGGVSPVNRFSDQIQGGMQGQSPGPIGSHQNLQQSMNNISQVTNQHTTRPTNTDFERNIDEVEQLIKDHFKDTMDIYGEVDSKKFFDELLQDPKFAAHLSHAIVPPHVQGEYLPLTVQENINGARQAAPPKMNFKTFLELFKTAQKAPGKYFHDKDRPIISEHQISTLHGTRRPYDGGFEIGHPKSLGALEPAEHGRIQQHHQAHLQQSQHGHGDGTHQMIKEIGWRDLLFPKSYRQIPIGHYPLLDKQHSHSHTQSHPAQGSNSRDVPCHSSLVHHPLHPNVHHHQYPPVTSLTKPTILQHSASSTRKDLEDKIKQHGRVSLEHTLKADRDKEMHRLKVQEEERVKAAKDKMYMELKEKYEERMLERQGKSKKSQMKKEREEKAAKESLAASHHTAFNKEKEEKNKRRRMEEVLRLEQTHGEDAMSEEEKVLLKEAKLQRKMGKL